MKNFIKEWLLPIGYQKAILRFKNKPNYDTQLLKKNLELKNKYKDQKCFILATGPSIKTQDLSVLKGEHCISVSNFFVHPLFNDIKPILHIFAASHPPITEYQFKEWLLEADKIIENKTPIAFNVVDKKIVDNYKIFQDKNTFLYAYGRQYPIDLTKPLPPIMTVVQIAIYYAIYMGFNEIFLLGCDHSGMLEVYKTEHFYQNTQHKLFENKYNEWENIDLLKHFKSCVDLLDIYKTILSDTTQKGIKIWNATPGSLLDTFERKKIL